MWRPLTPKTLLPLVLILAALAPQRAAAVASAWETNPQSSVRLITPWQVAPRDGEVHLGLHFKLAKGWHVYWKNSGDAGFPPVVVFGKAPGLGSTELLWPAPHRFELPGGLVAFGYETEVVYPVRAVLQGVAGNRLRLSADVDYLVCEVDCVPYRYTLTADQPLGASPVPDPETTPLINSWWGRLPASAESLPGVATDGVLVQGSPPVLEVRVRGARPAPGSTPGLFLETHEAFDTGQPAARTTDDGVIFRVPLEPHEAGKPLPASTAFAWTATGIAVDGRPVSLEARRTVAQGVASPVPPQPRPAIPRTSDPILIALLAVAATLGALWLWGVLGGRSGPRPGREALGFAAAAVTLGALWGMSRQVSFTGLAGIELALLAMALCAWLRRRAGRRRALSFLLAVGLAACAAAAPWLAHTNRLTPTSISRQEDSPS
jgi:DsbC/DsbD-like thiol-disulfide interchange protein